MIQAESTEAPSGQFQPVTGRALLVAGGFAVAAAAMTAAVLHGPTIHPEIRLSWLLVAAAVLGADLLVIELPGSGQSLALDMSAIPVAVGAVFTTARGLLGAVALAASLAALAARRHPDRAILSALNQVVATGCGELVLWLVLSGRPPAVPGGLGAVAAGAAAYQVSSLAGLLVYRSLVAQALVAKEVTAESGPLSELRSMALQVALICAYNTVLAVLAVWIGMQDTWGLLLLAAPAAFFGVWYRSVNAVQRRYRSMQMLYGFTAQLADLPDTESIVTAALGLCRQLLLCQHAHLVVQGAGQATRWEIPDGGGAAKVIDAEAAPAEPLVLDLRSVDAPVLMPKARVVATAAAPFQDAMAVRVSLGDEAEAGVLVVANRTVPGETFGQEDLRLFEALSTHLGTALTSSRRLEQLRTEVAAREHQALHDGLTGLANRTLFAQWVGQELARCPEGRHVAVLVMDLDGFKDINDSLGHHSGDRVLQQMAARLEALSSPTQLAARLGGDEFGFVLSGLAGHEEAEAAAKAISEEVARPVTLGDMALDLRASIGIALAPGHGEDPAALLQRADAAMYAAKASKRTSVVYDPEMERGTIRRLTLGSSLRQALESGRIEVWYQPVARSATGWTSGCEALLRWRDQEGFIPPSEFIPIAEHTGLIERLTWWTLDHALHELRGWLEEDLCPSVAVNLSPRCLQAPDVMRRVRDLLIQSDVPASALTLEITESLIMSDPELAEELLNQLGMMGVRVAIDDFGTGYSSLSRLKRLPVHTIKIDRDFVINMHADRDDEAIVKATLELARTLGCVVVAEGVETFEAWHQLQAFGCQQIQGFILAEPMPAQECRQWLRNRRNLLGRSTPDAT